MLVETMISWGYVELLRTFFLANDLKVTCEERIINGPKMVSLENNVQINLVFEDDSDTAMSITFMGVRHLGVEHMLCDYLIKCGVDKELISFGRMTIKRDMKKLDDEWMKYRREQLGFR